MAENKAYLQRYAMLFGTYMGVFWSVKFFLFPLGLNTPFLLFLFFGLTVCVPFMGFYYVRIYRDRICNRTIGFFHAWSFTFLMYMFAALLTAFFHYVYFRFIDQGHIVNSYAKLIEAFNANAISPGMEDYYTQLKDILEIIRSMTPIDITMQLMSQNIFYGVLLALLTAPCVMKRTVNRSDTPND